MAPDGELTERTREPGEITAADLVRYSPHQVDLGPGEAQTVRIQLRKPEALPDGEYRSHLVFAGVPPALPPPAPGDASETGLAITIRPVYGISIPVIVRHGATAGAVTLAELKFRTSADDPDTPELDLNLVRKGNRSLMGDLEVSVASGTALKQGTVVARARGLAVYSTLPARTVALLLSEKTRTFSTGRLKVTYHPADFKAPDQIAYVDVP